MYRLKNKQQLYFVPIVLVINYLAATLDNVILIANLLSASSDIPRSFGSRIEAIGKERTLKPDLGGFSNDVVEISTLGLEK